MFAPDNTPLSNTTWAYDSMGNRLSQTQDGISTFYTYNNLDQLVSTESGGALSTYSYDPRGNLLQTVSPTGTTTYTWDARDRMTGVVLPDTSQVSYAYDHENRRVASTEAGQTTSYLWDRLSVYGDVVAEYDSTGAAVVEYTLGGGRLISQERGGDTRYYLADGQNSTRNLTNELGAITDSYRYAAFGELVSSAGSTPNKYLYTGQQFDAATGQYSLRARYYQPGVGRFTARDQWAYDFRNPVEFNRYGYTANNPVNGWDPTGWQIIGEYGVTLENNSKAPVSASTYFQKTFWEGAAFAVIGYILGIILHAIITHIVTGEDLVEILWTGRSRTGKGLFILDIGLVALFGGLTNVFATAAADGFGGGIIHNNAQLIQLGKVNVVHGLNNINVTTRQWYHQRFHFIFLANFLGGSLNATSSAIVRGIVGDVEAVGATLLSGLIGALVGGQFSAYIEQLAFRGSISAKWKVFNTMFFSAVITAASEYATR